MLKYPEFFQMRKPHPLSEADVLFQCTLNKIFMQELFYRESLLYRNTSPTIRHFQSQQPCYSSTSIVSNNCILQFLTFLYSFTINHPRNQNLIQRFSAMSFIFTTMVSRYNNNSFVGYTCILYSLYNFSDTGIYLFNSS